MEFLSIFPLTGLTGMFVLIIVKITSLRKAGIPVKARDQKNQSPLFVLYVLFFILFVLWLAGIAEQTFHIRLSLLSPYLVKKLYHSVFLEAAGAVIIVSALVLMGITLEHFRTSLRFGLSSSNLGILITDGVFSFSRNPFFLSIILFFVGQALVFPGIIFITTAFLSVLSIHFYILKEERFLYSHYKEEYLKYKKKVRRYF